jgi:hypothetical protein
MHPRFLILAGLVCLACSKSGSSGGAAAAGSYSAANGDPFSFVFKSGGQVEFNGGPMGTGTGTYTVEGEKLLVTMNGRTYTFIKDGNCIEDNLQMFGKLCMGGASGAAANVSTRSAPVTSGSWKAGSSDGEFALEFTGDNKLTLTLTAPGGAPASKTGTFVVDGDVVQVTLEQSEPMTLKWVNDGYETSSFGLPMRFVKQ